MEIIRDKHFWLQSCCTKFHSLAPVFVFWLIHLLDCSLIQLRFLDLHALSHSIHKHTTTCRNGFGVFLLGIEEGAERKEND